MNPDAVLVEGGNGAEVEMTALAAIHSTKDTKWLVLELLLGFLAIAIDQFEQIDDSSQSQTTQNHMRGSNTLPQLEFVPNREPQSAVRVLQEFLQELQWAKTLLEVNLAAAEAAERLGELVS